MFFNIRSKFSAGAASLLCFAMAPAAFAGELAEAATSGMDKSELTLIGVAVMALCGVVALIRAGRRASGG
jgi:hypothetical protein